MRIISILITCVLVFPFIALASSPNQSDHYCDDKSSWQQWEQIISDNPQDEEIVSLYAFRIGLCSMVKSGQIETTRATKLFEQMRNTVLEGMEDDERRMKNKSGI